MYFISEHSTIGEHGYGTLIGIHENYLYSGNSYENCLTVRRRKIFETRGWERIFDLVITSWSTCSCIDTVAAAYGIIGDELFVAGYGKKVQNEDVPRLHLSSINLQTNIVINFVMTAADVSIFGFSLCDKCCISSILPIDPLNENEIAIVPWGPESVLRNGADISISKFVIDRLTNSCTLQETARFRMMELGNAVNQSNVVHFGFEKVIYFKNNQLILDGPHHQQRTIAIAEDSDLQKCLYAGFYRNAEGIYCVAFEKTRFTNQQTCNIYRVDVDEENLIAKFKRVVIIPHQLNPSDPRFSKFVLDSRMFIWSYQEQTFTFVLGVTNLSEAAYIAASNASSQLHHEYELLSKTEQFHFGDRIGIFREAENLGLSHSELKEVLGLPKTCVFPAV